LHLTDRFFYYCIRKIPRTRKPDMSHQYDPNST